MKAILATALLALTLAACSPGDATPNGGSPPAADSPAGNQPTSTTAPVVAPPTATVEIPQVAALTLLSSDCLNEQARGSCKGKVKNTGTTTFRNLSVTVVWLPGTLGQPAGRDHQWTQEGYTGPDAMRAALQAGDEWDWEVEIQGDSSAHSFQDYYFEFCEQAGGCINIQQ